MYQKYLLRQFENTFNELQIRGFFILLGEFINREKYYE